MKQGLKQMRHVAVVVGTEAVVAEVVLIAEVDINPAKVALFF